MRFLKHVIIVILTIESRLILRKYRPYIVAVTGSVGKTSTKDAIYSVLKDQSHYVRKSEKSMNSDIGLPLTVIGVPNAWKSLGGWLSNIRAGLHLILHRVDYPDCLILEIGADHPGDIVKVAKWLHPDIAVITRVSRMPVHVEFFKSPEEVFEEKAALADAVKAGGTLVLFADDDRVMSIVDRVKDHQPRIITFGTSAQATVRSSHSETKYDQTSGTRRPVGISFGLEISGSNQIVSVDGIIGETYQYPLLAAAAVGVARGVAPQAIAKSLNTYEAPRGRMNLISGINGSTLIDDTYNSSPDAAIAALASLRSLQCSGEKIAILGDMMELGKYSSEEHRTIGREAAGVVTTLITVGMRSMATADEAMKHGIPAESVHSFDTAEKAADYLKPLLKSSDIILIKGSQAVRLERAVKSLMLEPDLASDLLVRQEREWLEKK